MSRNGKKSFIVTGHSELHKEKTMSQLKKGMYTTREGTSVLFGIAYGQIRARNKVANQHGWFNKKGEEIGWGDLSAEDVVRISCEIEEDEFFITFNSEGSHSTTVVEDLEYVINHAYFVIGRGQLYCRNPSREGKCIIEGVEFKTIGRDELRKLLKKEDSAGGSFRQFIRWILRSTTSWIR